MFPLSYSKSLKVLTPDKDNFTGKISKVAAQRCSKGSRPKASSKSTSAGQHLGITVLSKSLHVLSFPKCPNPRCVCAFCPVVGIKTISRHDYGRLSWCGWKHELLICSIIRLKGLKAQAPALMVSGRSNPRRMTNSTPLCCFDPGFNNIIL